MEKFNARKLSSDPETHERRERRMTERIQKRQTDNFAFFHGNLTEEEARYLDYFETDIEEDPEDEYVETLRDEARIAQSGQFDPKLYDFIQTAMIDEVNENFDDIIADKIFKYKYRQNADAPSVYLARMERVESRFIERAKTRDPAIEQSLDDLYFDDTKATSIAALMVDAENHKDLAVEQTQPWREYMAREGVQQYRDYYEDEPEEQAFFEYLDNLTNRDQIRFMECFEDFTTIKSPRKAYSLIPRREFNPEISAFSNLLLDLVDFKDRVRPMANDIARHDAAYIYQKRNIDELE